MQLETTVIKQSGTWYYNSTDPEAEGAWRVRQIGNDLVWEQKKSGNWTEAYRRSSTL